MTDLRQALRATPAVREFTDEPVSRDTVAAILDTARFAPSGGNRQAWRVVLVEDPATKAALRDLYLPGWYDYLAMGAAGLVAWSPLADREQEAKAKEAAPEIAARAAAGPGGMAEHLERVPVLLAVFADLGSLAAVDRDLDRYTLVGGASVYPFVWSILLAAGEHGLGGVITTMLTAREAQVRDLLGAPASMALAAMVALGHPVRRPTKLRRRPVPEFATVDRVDGVPLEPR
ncbi:nitroreductase family protein [Acidiferrimicrobium sp. IK]|uniref:nitroreductase family protein n=1 Tax=Acidiferrimicrobium sp. IK TaxID=2871700 RepID=UPI0021CAF92F|nr:nitroreductase family protein [Acidiferrimicrobium sp. IK]MCU4183415.1 nitroreductase family protein [Acidiferrimicrobium sp. IK]